MSAEAVERLRAEDVEVVAEALRAAVEGPFFPDSEFHTLMGVTRAETRAVMEAWPKEDPNQLQDLAVSNVLNNLLGYPHGEWDKQDPPIAVNQEQVAAALVRWRGEEKLEGGGQGFFNRLK
jgi:hypothetical protein